MRIVVGLALVLAAGACTADEEARPAYAARQGDQCFNAASVDSFHPVGRDAVDVRVGARRYYRLDLGAGCFDVDWANRVALRSRTGSFICGAADAELIVPAVGGRGTDRCTVLRVRRLSDAEVETAQGRRRN
jgi:hypothetical protein